MNKQEITEGQYKRKKERDVQEVLEKVVRWRVLFEQGVENGNGTLQKFSLCEAANIVGLPKKSLEDYFQLLHKVTLVSDISKFMDKKMGFLRKFIRKNKGAIRKAKIKKIQSLEESKLHQEMNYLQDQTKCEFLIKEEEKEQTKQCLVKEEEQ